ncbi:hypothetical protein TRICI_001984 [Trichomonascus ciferrii]|uniref:Carboxylesterase type B domain-containing protein n=1 Tax=Trichomonascus ciferrii TaxID=44093 RepID=A0A642V828_9ASCO|nr:hypothetical protein TRICI_001984 [Trichomonascus ciferrii]
MKGLYCVLLGTLAAAEAFVADVGYAKYEGETTDYGVTNYYGIPFAAPPVEDLRWREPVAIEDSIEKNEEVVKATKVPSKCIQGTTDVEGSEDCLYLNMQVPKGATADSKLPVVVDIPDEGYASGQANDNGTYLIKQSDDSIIYVSVQYRLGIFGFLGGDQISQDGKKNVGLLDQRMALEWIKKHVVAFGGDPEKITLAAGSSALLQLVAYDGKQEDAPFHAAIVTSPLDAPMLTDENQNLEYHDVLNLANCQDLACLRSLSEDDFKAIAKKAYQKSYKQNGEGLTPWRPVLDGEFIKTLPQDAFSYFKYQNVSIIMEHTSHEGHKYTPTSLDTTEKEKQDIEQIFSECKDGFADRIFEIYPLSDYQNSTYEHRSAWFGDCFISCPTRSVVSHVGVNDGNPIYKSICDDETNTNIRSSTDKLEDASNAELAAKLAKYYISFIKTTGDPNTHKHSDAPEWPTYTMDADTLRIQDNSLEIKRDTDIKKGCDFFHYYTSCIRH